MYEGIYGAGQANRNSVMKNLEASADSTKEAMANYERIKDAADVSASDKNLALLKWHEAYDAQSLANQAYRALPEEVDAWATGDRVREFW